MVLPIGFVSPPSTPSPPHSPVNAPGLSPSSMSLTSDPHASLFNGQSARAVALNSASVPVATPSELAAIERVRAFGNVISEGEALMMIRRSVPYEETSPHNGLPRQATDVLKMWFLAHQANPYPTKSEKDLLQQQSGLTSEQLRNWLNNMRKRHWFPIKKGLRAPRTHEEYVLHQAQKRSRASIGEEEEDASAYGSDSLPNKRPRHDA